MSEIRIRGIDPDTHRGLKMSALREGVTMENLVKRLIGEYLAAIKSEEEQDERERAWRRANYPYQTI